MKRFATASGTPPVLHRNSANLMQGMLDEIKASITILPELQALIPLLQPAEYEQLKNNIHQDGCRDALLIWQTTQRIIDGTDNDSPVNVLIDGHNRYSICKGTPIDFKIVLRDFPDLQTVRDFMIDNQLGRRNLTPEQTSYLRGLKYRNERQTIGRPTQPEDLPDTKEDSEKTGQRTQDRLAKEFNVSPRTIHRDREYSEGIDRLTPDLKQEVLNGKQKVPKELIRSVGRKTAASNAPLSLPELLTFNESALPGRASEPGTDRTASLVNKIKDLVTKLDSTSPEFESNCDKIIRLLNEAKDLKRAKT